MEPITRAIRAEIAERRALYAGRPDLELLAHLVVALQRERVAALGNDTRRLGQRLEQTRLDEVARHTIMRAVAQIWLDENMHATYVIGVLRRQRGLGTQLKALAENLEGGVGGWMANVEQHETFREAPAERTAAAVLHVGALLTGRIPEEVKESLRRAPLSDWCRFSAAAEESAVESFRYMGALCDEVAALGAASELELPAGFAAEIERMRRDEITHQEIFNAIGSLLGADDALLPGRTSDHLIQALSAVEGWVAPDRFENSPGSDGPVDEPFARGSSVVVARGSGTADKLSTFDEALDRSGLFELAALRAHRSGRAPAELKIAIKIDLMMAYHRQDPSSYVDPALVERLAQRLRARGYRDLAVCDAQNYYSRYYANRTVESVGRYVGLGGGSYRLVDLSLELEPHTFHRGMGAYVIPRTWRDADLRISFAKLKTHPIACGQLTIRNTGTVIPEHGEHFSAERLSDFSTSTMAVLAEFPPHFGLIDGFEYAADGLLGVMADPTPRHPHLIIAGADVICVDHIGFQLMGYREPSRAPDLRAALEWFGDPRARARLIGDAAPIADWDRADEGVLAAPLAALSGPVWTWLSGDGALFSADMDPEAFPPLGTSAPVSAARRMLRSMLGYGRPVAKDPAGR